MVRRLQVSPVISTVPPLLVISFFYKQPNKIITNKLSAVPSG